MATGGTPPPCSKELKSGKRSMCLCQGWVLFFFLSLNTFRRDAWDVVLALPIPGISAMKFPNCERRGKNVALPFCSSLKLVFLKWVKNNKSWGADSSHLQHAFGSRDCVFSSFYHLHTGRNNAVWYQWLIMQCVGKLFIFDWIDTLILSVCKWKVVLMHSASWHFHFNLSFGDVRLQGMH